MFSERLADMRQLSWEKPGFTLFVNAKTCGINKDGEEQYKIDAATGARLGDIDNELRDSVLELQRNLTPPNSDYVERNQLTEKRVFVPAFYDQRTVAEIRAAFLGNAQFSLRAVGELIESGELFVRKGHGSPSQDQRVGDIPYVKVSDLRSGSININPTNLVPLTLAEEFWGDGGSGLQAFDLVSPERASKNIGEFCVLMPGQERIVLTREVLVFRSQSNVFDQFYLMWAMSLHLVRAQWSRIVFMQTNREDVGSRFHEIEIPVPVSKDVADQYSEPYKNYFRQTATLKSALRENLSKDGFRHHVFFA
jgi:hypothetical protein